MKLKHLMEDHKQHNNNVENDKPCDTKLTVLM